MQGLAEDDVADWRAQVQETLYLVLEGIVTESTSSLMLLKEAREELAQALVYGSYSDIGALIDRLLDSIEQAVNIVQKVVGQFDPPGQVAAALREPLRDRSAMERATEGMDSVQRERLALVLRAVFAETRKALAAAGEAHPATPPVAEVLNAKEIVTQVVKKRKPRRSTRARAPEPDPT